MLTDCSETPVTADAVKAAIAAKTLLWLDFQGVDDDVIALLRDDFHIHPLALEDAVEWNQRPKAEDYDSFVSIVMYGIRTKDDGDVVLSEVQIFYSEEFLISLHREPVAALESARHALSRNIRLQGTPPHMTALYRVLDALADSIFPALSGLDDDIDSLQDRIFTNATRDELSALFGIKRKIVEMRKVITPERDMMAAIMSGVVPVPSLTPARERYLRDVYDHLVRASDLTDSYRDLVSGSMDAYTSMESNKLNVVMKQLAIISTIFLPLSYLTGFFGQNFSWLVGRINGWEVFFGVGVGTEAVAVILLLALFRRRGWL
jgi:magnesium transporter